MEPSVGKLETNMSVFGEGMDLCGVEDRSNSLEGGVASSGDVASSGGMASSGGTKESSESVTASPPGSSLNAKPPPILPLNAPTPITTPTKETQENAGIASFSSCVFNVANQIIGAGILTIPYSIHGAGIYGSALMLLLSFVLSLLSAHYLTIASEYTHKDTYGGISSVLCRPWVSVFSDVSLTFFNFGTSVSYFIILYDQVDDLLASWFGVSSSFLSTRHAVDSIALPSF